MKYRPTKSVRTIRGIEVTTTSLVEAVVRSRTVQAHSVDGVFVDLPSGAEAQPSGPR